MTEKLFLQPHRLRTWMDATFGGTINVDVEERLLRLGEETIELAQAEGISKEQMLGLVEQVYAKPPGEVDQEQGGMAVCIAAYAAVKDVDLFGPDGPFEREMQRIEQPFMMEKIRAKHATKAVVSSRFR